MKHLKKFEIYVDAQNVDQEYDKVKHLKYKIGDYIKLTNIGNRPIFQIIGINTEDRFQPYKIKDEIGDIWINDANFKKLSKKELDYFLMKKDAGKYNI